MRALFWLLTMVALLIFSLWPRPFVKPDWRTPLERAIAAKDCVAIERLADLLDATGHGSEFEETAANLAEAKLCRFATLDAARIANLRAVAKQGHSRSDLSREIRERSPLGSRVAYYFGERPYSKDPVFRSAQLRSQEIWRVCKVALEPIAGGIPDHHLLAYALKNPEIPFEEIARIRQEQSALCAHEWVMVAKLMAVSARSDADLERAVSSYVWAGLADNMAPELSEIVARIAQDLRARGATPGDHYLPSTEEFAAELCDSTYVPGRALWSAMQCASLKNLYADDLRTSDMRAVYFARRAQRLGWRDAAAIEAGAAARLSPECVAAMRDVEVREAGNATDPRDFASLQWPIGHGEACETEGQ